MCFAKRLVLFGKRDTFIYVIALMGIIAVVILLYILSKNGTYTYAQNSGIYEIDRGDRIYDYNYAEMEVQYDDVVSKIDTLNETRETLVNYRESLQKELDTATNSEDSQNEELDLRDESDANNQTSLSQADIMAAIEDVNNQIDMIDVQLTQYRSSKILWRIAYPCKVSGRSY